MAQLIKQIKGGSSHWIKSKDLYYNHFEWQAGYASYSVSQSKVEIVRKYIENQKDHHKTTSFKDEYIAFLKEYGIDFNETFLWT